MAFFTPILASAFFTRFYAFFKNVILRDFYLPPVRVFYSDHRKRFFLVSHYYRGNYFAWVVIWSNPELLRILE